MAILTIFLTIAAIFIHCFTASTIWNWFAVPFFNLPQITSLMALGMSYVVAAFRGVHVSLEDIRATTEERNELQIMRLCVGIVYSLILLGSSAIVNAFLN